MPRAAAHVFVNNYRLHMGALAACALAHALIVLTVPEARTHHALAFFATLPLLAGRAALHRHARPADAQRWASTGWCLTIIVVYITSVLDPVKACEPAERAAADPAFGMAIFAFCALVGMMTASVGPPWPHLVALFGVTTTTVAIVLAQTHSRAMIGWGVGLVASHVCGYALSTHCFEQQAAIVRFKEDQAEVERRVAQLVGEKERLAWEVASSHHGDGDDPLAALGAALPVGEPTAQHLVLGVLQPQEITDDLISLAVSADHAPSSGSPTPLHASDLSHETPPPGPLFTRQLPVVEPVPHLSLGSARSVSVTSSLRRRTPSLVASSVMDTHSVAAAKDITRAPRMPRDDTVLPRPCLKTRSDPGA